MSHARILFALLVLFVAAPVAYAQDATTPAAGAAAPNAEATTPPNTAAAEAPPAATTPSAEPDDFRHKLLTLGLRAGVWVPSIFNAMGPHANLSVEVGIVLPFADGRLSIVGDAGWAPPGASGTGMDPRIGATGGPWTYSMTTQELMFSLGPLFRFLPPGSVFVPYVGVLARVYLLETTVSGTGGGSAFGENKEHSTQFGVVGLLGGELRLGPGALLLEVSLGWSDLPHVTTGETVTSALAAQVGYRIFL